MSPPQRNPRGRSPWAPSKDKRLSLARWCAVRDHLWDRKCPSTYFQTFILTDLRATAPKRDALFTSVSNNWRRQIEPAHDVRLAISAFTWQCGKTIRVSTLFLFLFTVLFLLDEFLHFPFFTYENCYFFIIFYGISFWIFTFFHLW